MQVLTGHTPDISMFRFKFWEPVWYYDPTARVPSQIFLPGKHIGIAWRHGDVFNGKWDDDRLLIRNIVKSRDGEELVPYIDYPTSALTISRKKLKRRGRKRKRNDEITSDDLLLLWYIKTIQSKLNARK